MRIYQALAVFAVTVHAQDEAAADAEAAPAAETVAPFVNSYFCKYYCAVSKPDLSSAYN